MGRPPHGIKGGDIGLEVSVRDCCEMMSVKMSFGGDGHRQRVVLRSRKVSPLSLAVTVLTTLVLLSRTTSAQADIFDVVSDVGFEDPFNYFWNTRNTFINTVNEPCVSPSPLGNIQGSCQNGADCRFSGGQSFGRGNCNFFSTCCVYQRSCGRTTRAKVSTFVNPQPSQTFPNTCDYRVQLLNPNICQVRIDIDTNLAEPGTYPLPIPSPEGAPDPNSGVCIHDYIEIAGIPGIEKICGVNSRQHVYVPVSSSQRSLDIRVVIENRTTLEPNQILNGPSWNLKVTQLECPGRSAFFTAGNKSQSAADFSQLAPEGCTQYFTDVSGEIKTFNYEGSRTYINKMDYAICFKRPPGSCGVAFKSGEFLLETGPPCLDYLAIPEILSPDPTVEPVYVEKQCGDGSTDMFPWISQHPGPLYVHFHSNDKTAEKGFKLKYSTVNNCQPGFI